MAKTDAPAGWPDGVRKIAYRSDADDTDQPALFYAPDTGKPRPLLVGLHTWSGNYLQKNATYARWCIDKQWVFIHPHFRGPNWTPQATGSELVVKDITSAVAYARQNAKVDAKRIYLVGASGGGYTSLLLAGRAPHIWAGVSAWVPITDLAAWYRQCKKRKLGYANHVVKSCGGVPTPGSDAEAECNKRSPLTYLHRAAGVPIDINAGIRDGHRGSVPISHSLHAFNLLAKSKARLTDAQIALLVDQAKVPPGLEPKRPDPLYGRKKVLFRRASNNVRVTIFDGGHEIIVRAALTWLEKQRKSD